MKNTLVIIPARSGSKEIQNKNIKLLNGVPLIKYTLNFALEFFSKSNICISTNSDKIIDLLANKIDILFKRPESLSDDFTSMSDVISHAISYYRKKTNLKFDKVLLLQPTSPIRNKKDLFRLYDSFDKNSDMVISVAKSKISPEFNLFRDSSNGYIEKVSNKAISTRQESKNYYYANGSMYLINTSGDEVDLNKMKKIKKIIMEPFYSIDIDDLFDWKIAEIILKNA